MADKPGYFEGQHYTEYVEQVKRLRRAGKEEQAAALLMKVIDATEAESRDQGHGVAPWYYEQLAIIYRKVGQLDDEIDILRRFASQKHAPGVMPPKLMDRLKKAVEKRQQNHDNR